MHLPEKQEARKEIIKIIRYMSLPPIKIYFGFDKDDYGDFDNDPQEYTQKEISKDYDKTIKLYKKSIKWYMQFVGEWKAPVRGNPFTVSIDTIKIPCPYCGSYFKGDKCKSCGAQKPIMGDEE